MSDVLLDTHALFWWVESPHRLSDRADREIASAPEVYVSHVAMWELVIKQATRHPLLATNDVHGWFREAVRRSGFRVLPIELDHIGAVGRLPPHHGDPFDRLLVAQAMVEQLRIVSGDRRLAAYELDVVW